MLNRIQHAGDPIDHILAIGLNPLRRCPCTCSTCQFRARDSLHIGDATPELGERGPPKDMAAEVVVIGERREESPNPNLVGGRGDMGGGTCAVGVGEDEVSYRGEVARR